MFGEIKWPGKSKAIVVSLNCDTLRYSRYANGVCTNIVDADAPIPPELVEMFRVRPQELLDMPDPEPEVA